MTGLAIRAFNAAYADAPGFRGFLARHWPLLVTLLVAAVYMGTLTLLHTWSVSPIDEVVYIDYLDKLWRQGVIHDGEYLGELVRNLYACHGVIPFGRMGPICGMDLGNPSDFPFGGFSSGSGYPPVQFWIIRVMGDALGLIPGVGQLAGWRLVGTLWLTGGLVFCYLISRMLRITGWAFVAVALAIVASPLSYWSFSFVSTDAPMFFLGALLLWLAMRYVRGIGSGWWIVAVSALGAMFKPTIIVVVGLVLVYLLLHWAIGLRGSGRDVRAAQRVGSLARRLWPPLLAIVAALAIQFAWKRIQTILQVPKQTISPGQGVEVPLSFDLIGTQFTNFLGGSIHMVVPQVEGITNAFIPLGWLVLAGVVGAALLLPRASSDRALSVSVLVAFIVAAPVLTIALVLATGSIFPLPPRYGIALVPGMLAVTVPLLRNRWAVRALLIYGVLLMILWIILSVVFARWFA